MSMEYIKFFSGTQMYHVDMSVQSANIIKFVFSSNIPTSSELASGFYIANEHTGANMSGDLYKPYSTVYKKELNMIWLSNDGSKESAKVAKFFLTTDAKLSSIPHEIGQLIFVKDSRKIYFDDQTERKAYEQIICLATDAQRIAMTSTLVSGFYFVLETNILWRLDGYTWIQITEKPEQIVIYGSLGTFPRPGTVGKLYMTDDALYHWDPTTQAYVDYCKATPQWIVEI